MFLLFDFDGSAGGGKIGLDLFRIFFGNALFESFRNSLYEFFCLFESEAGNLANRLDNAEFAVAKGCKNNIKFSFLFGSGSSGTTANSSNSDRSRGNSEFFLESFYEVSDLKNGKRFDFIKNRRDFFLCHDYFTSIE